MAGPRRRRRAPASDRPEPQAPGKCFCGAPAAPGSDYCMGHALSDWLADNARKANRRGKSFEAVLFGGAAALVDNAQRHDLVGKAAVAYAMREQRKRAAEAPKPPKPAKPDPFALLHLDAKTATVEDVRRVQRALAKIYHTDLNATGLADDAMAEINVAVEEAIKQIKAR